MLCVNGVQLEFDITCPDCLLRLDAAEKAAAEKQSALPAPKKHAAGRPIAAYAAWMGKVICIFSEFLNEAFGEGAAAQLLGEAPSLERMAAVSEALGEALTESANTAAQRFTEYTPYRAQRGEA